MLALSTFFALRDAVSASAEHQVVVQEELVAGAVLLDKMESVM
jgi:hypothetical protein